MTNSEAVGILMSSQYYSRGYKQGVSDVLDKIRDEIEKTKTTMNMFNREDTKQYAIAMEDALKIIDKYKVESEER